MCYFNDVTWPELFKRKGQKKRGTIYCLHDQNHNEFFDLQSKREPSYQDTLAQLSKAYRDLKVIYEQEHDYIYASDFHYLEKDLRRKNRDVPPQTKIQLWLYYWVSGYGERVLRPLFLAIAVFFMGAFTYYYDAVGLECGEHLESNMRFTVNATESSATFEMKIVDGTLRVANITSQEEALPKKLLKPKAYCKSMWEASLESIETMTLLRTNQSNPDQESFRKHTMRIFQMIVGPALAAMFVLAIKNKLKR